MSLYTIVFIFVTLLIVTGLALFGLLISKIDRWIDRRDRVGRESIYTTKPKVQTPKIKTEESNLSDKTEVKD